MAENNVPVKVINDACNKTTEISSYRNFSNNKMVKKMKKIFISFSRKDVDFKNELKKHLSILNLFEISDNWSCEEIAIGTWDNQIQTELENSDLIIYMLSANFFSSSYIVKKELNIINNENPNKHFLCVRVSEFANLDNIEESVSATHNISDIQKSILRLRDYQHLPYTTKFNMVSKQNEEMLSSLKTFSNENKIEDALKQVVDHIQRLFLK